MQWRSSKRIGIERRIENVGTILLDGKTFHALANC